MKQVDTYSYSDTPQARYDKVNTVYINLRLLKENDKDLIEALSGKAKQTEVKRLVRLGIGKERHDQRLKKESI